ncbi:MAG: DUF4399 domain-containing protein [Proteobacteria bacterium]|nr:DUF4399 domain-containing protein [Pseudomonadota bacterium]
MRIVLVAAIALICASAVAQDAAKPAAMANPAAPKDARVFIVSPKNGASVGQDVHVVFGVKGIKVAPATDTASGTGHHHLLIDVKELPPLDAPIPADANHKHYGKGQTGDTIHLLPGDHTLQLDFADYRHVQFNPPLVSQRITVHVK